MDQVSTRQASLGGEVGKAKFNFMFDAIRRVCQYYKTNNTSGENRPFQTEMKRIESRNVGLAKPENWLLPDFKE